MKMEKKLIIGLGNIGHSYINSRHNIGHKIIDYMINKYKLISISKSFGFLYKKNINNISFIFMKPKSYMNLIGISINHCIKEENISINNILIIVDDIRLSLGKIKIKSQGGSGGHNGLKSIQNILHTSFYSRLRFGIGNSFVKGEQINYVLGNWKKKELIVLNAIIPKACKSIISFGLNGIEYTMNNFKNIIC